MLIMLIWVFFDNIFNDRRISRIEKNIGQILYKNFPTYTRVYTVGKHTFVITTVWLNIAYFPLQKNETCV